MIITYLRSSSYGAHEMCPHSYFLNYVLGIRSTAGKSAAIGNVVHKALEVMALLKKAHQDRTQPVDEDGICGQMILGFQERLEEEGVPAEDLTIDDVIGRFLHLDDTLQTAVLLSYNHYKKIETHVDWYDRADIPECQNLAMRVRTEWSGLYDPSRQYIVQAEQKFDIVIDKPWAEYSYETPTGVVEGKLAIKGTIDLVLGDPDDPNYIHVVDWKTGRRWDWASDEEKTFRKLMKDPQLLMYYYAVTKLYPDVTDIDFTIVFIKDGGPFCLYFGPKHLEFAEEMLRVKFEEIRETQRPSLSKSWKCKKFCYFGKTMSERDPTKTLCEFYEGEVRRKGADAATFEFGVPGAFASYGDGGGRKAE